MKGGWWWLVLFATMAIFLAGLIRLFVLRYELGDVYAPYSTYRSDPLGTAVLYGALAALPDLRVARYLDPMQELPPGRDTTLLFCGATLGEDSKRDIEALERFVSEGGRLVGAFYPVAEKPRESTVRRGLEAGKSEGEGEGEGEGDDAGKRRKRPGETETVSIEDRWDIAFDFRPVKTDTKGRIVPVDAQRTSDAPDSLPETLTWHTALGFGVWDLGCGESEGSDPATGASDSPTTTPQSPMADPESPVSSPPLRTPKPQTPNPKPESVSVSELWDHAAGVLRGLMDVIGLRPPVPVWRVLYQCSGRPAIIERDWGAGTIVLCADAYPLSNEALSRERSAALPAWLLGPSKTILFDETHLGTSERYGVMRLVREYRLGWLVAAAFATALLAAWRNASSLVPKREQTALETAPAELGKEAASGLVDLLRRSVAPADLPAVCLEEWRRTHSGKVDAALWNRMASVADEPRLPGRTSDPARAYRRIAAILAERRSSP